MATGKITIVTPNARVAFVVGDDDNVIRPVLDISLPDKAIANGSNVGYEKSNDHGVEVAINIQPLPI